MEKEQGKEEKIVGPNWMPKNDFKLEMDVADQDNPRLLLNLPANSGFFEITETQPPYLVICVRADKPILAKGFLEHAKDALFLMEHKLNKLTALTLGVGGAAAAGDLKGQTLTEKDIKAKLAKGVH